MQNIYLSSDIRELVEISYMIYAEQHSQIVCCTLIFAHLFPFCALAEFAQPE